MELYLLGLGGVVLHLLTKIYNARKTNEKLDYFLEGISSSISILIVVLFVYAREDLAVFYPLTLFTTILLGYSAQSLARQLFKMAKPKKIQE